MNAQEAATLCRATKAMCPQQKIDEFTPDFWHPLLEDIEFEEAKRALIEVAKRQPFVSPAEIRAQVASTRRRLVAEIPPVVPPWQLADLPADEARWIANFRHAIADGLPEETAKAKANYMAGLHDSEEPLAIEAAEADKLRALVAETGQQMTLAAKNRDAATTERRAKREARDRAALEREATRYDETSRLPVVDATEHTKDVA